MIESMKALKRRELAIETALKINNHPAYPFDEEFPRAMVTIIDLALEQWEKDNS